MAGAVLKTLGGILTILGALAAVLGLVAAVAGLQQVDAEAQRLLPNEDRAENSARLGLAGLVALGGGAVLLLIGLVPLVAGFHRAEDAGTGRARTRRGGILTAFGTSFLVVGALALLVATICFVYATNVASEESGRALQNGARGDLAEAVYHGGLAAAALAAALLVLALPLLVAGRVRAANDPPMALGAAPDSAGASAGIVATGGASSATSSRRATSSTLMVAGGLVFASFLIVGLFATLGGTTLGALGTSSGEGSPVERLFEGELTGGRLPTGTVVGAADANATHELAPATRYGVVEAALEWQPGATDARLELLLEMQNANGEWELLKRSEGDSGALISLGPMSITGAVRATISFASGSGGQDVPYGLLLRILPSG